MDLKGSLEETSQVVKSQGTLETSIPKLNSTPVPVNGNRIFFFLYYQELPILNYFSQEICQLGR